MLASLCLFGLLYGGVYLVSDWINNNEDLNNTDPLTVHSSTEPQIIPSSSPTATSTPTPEPSKAPVINEAVWVGVGDVMSHSPQLPGAFNASTKRYDFTPYFQGIKNKLQEGDWIMANLETPVAGADLGYSGYPAFNAPDELAEALKDVGFNILSTANNHSLDRGEQGIIRTNALLKKLKLAFVGTASSDEEAKEQVIIEKNGIRMGFLSYTYGTNGIPIPKGKPYMVNLIDEKKIKEDISSLRQAGADLITVAMHFGIEYQTSPSEEQKSIARSLVAAGADIIAGSHPHVIQPYEVIETTDHSGQAKRSLIIYSMGNFISNQRGETKDYGVVFKVNFRKNMDSLQTELVDVEATPTWVHRYKPDKHYRYRILPVQETFTDKSDPLLTETEYSMLKKDYAMLVKRLEAMKQ